MVCPRAPSRAAEIRLAGHLPPFGPHRGRRRRNAQTAGEWRVGKSGGGAQKVWLRARHPRSPGLPPGQRQRSLGRIGALPDLNIVLHADGFPRS